MYKDFNGEIAYSDKYYDYDTTLQLTECSIEYNNAKLKNDEDGMHRAAQKAEGIRISSKKNEVDIDKMGIFEAVISEDANSKECRDMAILVEAAYAYADGTEFEYGSLEYGLIVTIFMIDGLEIYESNNELIGEAQELYSNYVDSGSLNEALFIASLPPGTADTLDILEKTQENY